MTDTLDMIRCCEGVVKKAARRRARAQKSGEEQLRLSQAPDDDEPMPGDCN